MLNQRDLARLLVKIAALIIIVSALTSIPENIRSLLVSSKRAGGWEFVGFCFAPESISIIVGLAMFWWAGPIVDRTLVKRLPGSGDETVDLQGFEEIAVTVLGIYVLSAGLAEGIYYWAKWDIYVHWVLGEDLLGGKIPPTEFAGLAAGGTRVILGILLILCSRGFVALKLRLLALRRVAPTLATLDPENSSRV